MPNPDALFAMLIRCMSADNGCNFPYTDAHRDGARFPIAVLHSYGFFHDYDGAEHNLDSSFWMMAAGEESEVEHLFTSGQPAEVVEAFRALSAILNSIFEGT